MSKPTGQKFDTKDSNGKTDKWAEMVTSVNGKIGKTERGSVRMVIMVKPLSAQKWPNW